MVSLFFSSILLKNVDHPIHPPVYEGDPFDIEILPSLKCKLKFEAGVVHVYTDEDKPFSDYVYPNLKVFLDDYHLMVNLIGNGPL
jgi:hypothetical protein